MAMAYGREEGLSDLGPERMAVLLGCVESAWQQYDAVMRPLIPLSSATGIATCMHELTVQQVRARFDGLPGVILHDNKLGGRFLVEVDNRLLLQFKKLTQDFRTVNNPTPTSESFDAQQEIEGLPPIPRLILGYQLNQYRTDLAGVYLAFNVGQENIWYHDLRSGEGGQASTALVFPQLVGPSAGEKEAAAQRKLKLTDASKDETGSEG